jgi:hypothetical protein
VTDFVLDNSVTMRWCLRAAATIKPTRFFSSWGSVDVMFPIHNEDTTAGRYELDRLGATKRRLARADCG